MGEKKVILAYIVLEVSISGWLAPVRQAVFRGSGSRRVEEMVVHNSQKPREENEPSWKNTYLPRAHPKGPLPELHTTAAVLFVHEICLPTQRIMY